MEWRRFAERCDRVQDMLNEIGPYHDPPKEAWYLRELSPLPPDGPSVDSWHGTDLYALSRSYATSYQELVAFLLEWAERHRCLFRLGAWVVYVEDDRVDELAEHVDLLGERFFGRWIEVLPAGSSSESSSG